MINFCYNLCMFAVSKHVTLWMRQTGSEGRGEAGKCACIICVYFKMLNTEKVKLINI